MEQQPIFNQTPSPDKKRYIGVLFFVLTAVAIIYLVPRSELGSHSITVANTGQKQDSIWNGLANIFNFSGQPEPKEPPIEKDPDYAMPKADDGRWDLLVLGMRGLDQPDPVDTGPLLTDTIILISYNQDTGKTSMVSIPRDLYLKIYGTKKDKINTAYQVGLARNDGLTFVKKLFSRITGVYIDSAVVVDFSAFKSIINQLGGVDVTLDKPFSETQQWGYTFSLPAGLNHLNSDQALYYARSRYSSNDFDRAARQQQIVMAVKDKISALNILSDPIRTLGVLNTVRTNINTDLNVWDIGNLINLSNQFKNANSIKKYVLSTENLLAEGRFNDMYILTPKSGNLQEIKKFFQDIVK